MFISIVEPKYASAGEEVISSRDVLFCCVWFCETGMVFAEEAEALLLSVTVRLTE